MKNERLLIFLENSAEDVHQHQKEDDPHTDEHGFALLTNENSYSYLQVCVDFRTLCQTNPNVRTFAIDEVLHLGARTLNNCGKSIHQNESSTFIVYGRHFDITGAMGALEALHPVDCVGSPVRAAE